MNTTSYRITATATGTAFKLVGVDGQEAGLPVTDSSGMVVKFATKDEARQFCQVTFQVPAIG
jgi:hypothetical protein